MRPTECAVFLKDRTTSISLAPDGQAYPSPAQVTCIVFKRLDAAQRFCEAKVQTLPQLRCEIYDAQGLAHPPIAVILHPESQGREEAGPIWSRRRKLGAGALSLISLPLFWMGIWSSNSRDLAIFLGINCILVALRFLYWDFGLKHRTRAAQAPGEPSEDGKRRCLNSNYCFCSAVVLMSFSETRSKTARTAGRLANPVHVHREVLRKAVIRTQWRSGCCQFTSPRLAGPRRRDNRR